MFQLQWQSPHVGWRTIPTHPELVEHDSLAAARKAFVELHYKQAANLGECRVLDLDTLTIYPVEEPAK